MTKMHYHEGNFPEYSAFFRGFSTTIFLILQCSAANNRTALSFWYFEIRGALSVTRSYTGAFHAPDLRRPAARIIGISSPDRPIVSLDAIGAVRAAVFPASVQNTACTSTM